MEIDCLWRRQALREESCSCLFWEKILETEGQERLILSGRSDGISQRRMIIAMIGSPLDMTPHSPVSTGNGEPVLSPAAALAPVPFLNLCVTTEGVPRNGEVSAFLMCLSDVVTPHKVIKVAWETA